MNKKIAAAILLSGSLLMANGVFVMAENASILPTDIYSFTLRIGENVYHVPMPYSDFKASGWTLDGEEAEEETLGTNQYSWLYMNKGDDEVTVDVINFDINQIKIKDGYVGGIEIEDRFNFDATEVELPNGIFMGKATLEDITSAYGTPSDTYEGDLYTKVTYESDTYEEIALYVDNESGVLNQIDIQNFSMPEDFEAGEVSTEIPAAVSEYIAPEALSDDVTDPIVEYFGDLYQLPAPVAAFVANGWEIQDGVENDVVEGRGICFFNMIRDNQSVRFTGYNTDPNATILANTMVKELSYATYDSDLIAMKTSGGVELGMNIDDVIKAATEKGSFVKDDRADDNYYIRICKTEDDQYSNYTEFWINNNEDKTAIASIDVRVR